MYNKNRKLLSINNSFEDTYFKAKRKSRVNHTRPKQMDKQIGILQKRYANIIAKLYHIDFPINHHKIYQYGEGMIYQEENSG